MGVSGNKLAAPVGLQEVYGLLGVSAKGGVYDVAHICGNSHGKINKWSKRKPVRYGTPAALTDAQFKGEAADNANGVYYGLKAATLAGKYGDLHGATFEYQPPRPGTDWCRLTDFDGYDHAARCTLEGEIPASAYLDVARNFACRVDYDHSGTNTTGVDYAEIIDIQSDSVKFGDYYPCILVGKYARGLFNTATGTQTPLKHNGAWQQQFYADLSGYPGLEAGTYTCTLFLLRELFIAGITDLREWQNVADTVNARQAFAVPGAVAVECELRKLVSHARLVVTGCAKVSGGFTLLTSFPDGKPEKETTYRITFSKPGRGSVDWTYRPGTLAGNINVSFADLGITDQPGKTYDVAGTVACGGAAVSSFSFTGVG